MDYENSSILGWHRQNSEDCYGIITLIKYREVVYIIKVLCCAFQAIAELIIRHCHRKYLLIIFMYILATILVLLKTKITSYCICSLIY